MGVCVCVCVEKFAVAPAFAEPEQNAHRRCSAATSAASVHLSLVVTTLLIHTYTICICNASPGDDVSIRTSHHLCTFTASGRSAADWCGWNSCRFCRWRSTEDCVCHSSRCRCMLRILPSSNSVIFVPPFVRYR